MTRLQTLALPLLVLSTVASQRALNTAVGWNFDNPACLGTHQSPISFSLQNISDVKVWNTQNPPLQFNGDCDESTGKKLENMYQWDIQDDENCTAKASNNGREYSLHQFSLHLMSEHMINNERYDAELQFVHKALDGSGHYLVVGVFLQAAKAALSNVFVQNLLREMETFPLDVDESDVNFAEMLNNLVKTTHLLNYSGSLTTPECSEHVDWWVLINPITIAVADLQRMKALYAILPQSLNTRPVQPLNGRNVVYYFRQ